MLAGVAIVAAPGQVVRAAPLSKLQSGTVVLNAGAGAAQVIDVPVSAVDPAKTILFFNMHGDSQDPGDGEVRAQLTSATTIQFYRPNDSSLTDLTAHWFLAEFAAGVSVQRGTYTGVNSAGSVAIAAVDPAKSFVMVSGSVTDSSVHYGNDDYYRARLVSPTELEIRHNAVAATTADWQVIQYEDASVQRGSGSLAGGTMTANVGITAVDLSRAIVLLSWRTTINGTGANFLKARFTAADQITIDRASNIAATLGYAWEVVEFTDDTIVQSGVLAFGAAETSRTAVLNAVDPTATVALLSTAGGRWGGTHSFVTNDRIGPGMFTTLLTDPTTLTLTRQVTGSVAANAAWFVVQFPGPVGVILTESGGTTNVAEGGGTDSYTLVLKSRPTADVLITVQPDGQAVASGGAGSPMVLTFTPADWDQPQTVTVTAINDAIAEGAHVSSIAHSVASADTVYNNWVMGAVTANIQDNDTAGITLSESQGSTAVDEDGTPTDTYTLVLTSQPLADVIIALTPDAQLDLGEGAGVPITITISSAQWSDPQTVSVAAVDDGFIEGPHTGTITHTIGSADPFYDGMALPDLTVDVGDDDFPGVDVIESDGASVVMEAGPTSDTYTLTLAAVPAADVAVTADPDFRLDLGDGPGEAVTVVFTPADWNVPQTITLTAVDDAVHQSDRESVIVHTTASADARFDGIAVVMVRAEVIDNEQSPPPVWPGAPLPKSLELTTREDAPVAMRLSAAGLPGERIRYYVVGAPAHGTVAGNPPDLVYAPARNFVGDDSLQFVAAGRSGSSKPAVITIHVLPANDPPVAVPLEVDLTGNSRVVIVLSGTDADQDPLTYALVEPPEHGLLMGVLPKVVYRPEIGFVGTDRFRFVVHDGQAGSAPATVTITVRPPEQVADSTPEAPPATVEEPPSSDLVEEPPCPGCGAGVWPFSCALLLMRPLFLRGRST